MNPTSGQKLLVPPSADLTLAFNREAPGIGATPGQVVTNIPNAVWSTPSKYWYLGPALVLVALGGGLAAMHFCLDVPLDTIVAVASIAMVVGSIAIAIIALRNKELCILGKVLTCIILALGLTMAGLSLSSHIATALSTKHSILAWCTLAIGSDFALVAAISAICINHWRLRSP